MKNDLTWLDELPDFGAESSENVVNETAVAEVKPLPVAVAPGVPVAQREGDLKAFLLAGVTNDAEAHARLKQNAELEGLNARRGKMDALNSRAVAGQTIMRYAYPELGQEPGAYFQKVGKALPECQTRTDAYAAVYDDYMAGVEAEYNALMERRKAWDRNKAVVSQAASDMVAGRVSVPELMQRLDVEQQKVYEQEFDAAAMEKAGVAMSLVREAFSESAEAGLKKMVDQGLANQVTAALSDADEAGGLVVNEKAAGMFQAALMSLMKEARQASGEEYKFLHNMTMALGNPVRRRKKDIQGVLGMMVQADTAAALAMAGEDKESRKVTAEIEKNIEELRGRWQNDTVYARLRGMLDAAQSAGNETAETADFWAKTVNALGSVIGQTAPFFVPGMGTGLAFAMAYDEKRNAAYFKGLKEGTAEWSAFIDAATSVAVEKIAFGGWNRFSATARVMEKIPGYGAVRNTLLGSFYARAALEVGAGVFEESVLEPTAEALLQWGLRNGVFRWSDVGGKYDWEEYAKEMQAMFKPEQLMATVIFGAGLTGVQSPLIKEAAKGYSKHVEYLMAQGIGEEEARNIAAMDDADARVEAAVRARAEAWKDPAAAELHRRIAATRFAEIEEARALWESKAYAEMKKELRLPDVERLEGKAGQYSITTYDSTTGDVLFRGEVGEEQLLAMLGHYIREEDRLRVHRAQSVMGANALLRAVERTGEIVVEDLGEARNPESGERVISDFGMMGEAEFKYAAALALDEYEARRERGMSEEEALATPFAALSKYMPLRGWMALEEAFKERLETARQTSGEQDAVGTRLFQTVPAEGASKADTLFMASRGQVEAREVLEDTLEHGQKKVTGNDPAKIRAWHGLLRDAQKAMKQLGFKVDFYTGHDDMDAAALQGRITEGMSKLASSYVLTQADALPLPGWVKDLFRWHTAQLEDAAALVALGNAYKLGRERGNISQDIEDILRELGHKAASMYQTAELTEVDVQAYKEARMRYMDVTGDVTPTATEVRAEQAAADAEERERVRAADDVKSVLPPREDGLLDERTISPVGDLPAEVRGAFPKGACYNLGARAWLGMVPVARLHLSPDAPQVKVGGNKKGVVNPLVGDYRQDAPPLYVWQRRNGTLEVISGRHRLDLAKRTGTEFVAAYVYVEDEQHDAKWARLLDYEQNMQDDQADELTAAIYVRETQLSDEELTRRGLTRGGTKSARGILIGREAREDLWSRFQSKAIDARTAEAICKLTMYMPDKSRIDAMQAMAAADLAKGKSLDHVAAKLQLMAHADADGEAVQGLLSFGESFDEALERSAEFIAKSIEVINKHIAAVTKARQLGKGGVSEQEGISVGLDMDPKQRLAELNELKAAYEKCGFHENIRFRALTWDGKSDVDPIGDYARDKAAAAEWAEPTEEELEQQARDEAAEATGTFGFSVATAQEMAQIKAAAEKDGTFMKAPNGQRSNLNERQWLQVRTAAFKRWFGDWEKVSLFRAAYNRIMSMASVASLSGKEFGRGLTPEKMAGHWQTVCGGKVEHDALGVVVLTKRSAKDCLAHGLHREKIAVFAKVHDVIRNGVVFDRQSNWKQRGYDTCCLAAPVTINGKEYICQVVVKQFKDRNQFYLHEVELKEKLPTEGRTGFYFGSTSGGATGLITQKADEVNALWKNCSKIVDSNGEPMVMYHGSPTAGIREFRNHRALYGDGVFFTESPEEALEYTGLDRDDFEDYDEMDAAAVERGLLYECFLNIRDGERFYHGGGGTYHAMATAPTEIKSATDNRGSFDGSNPDITFSVVGQNAANWDKIKHRAFTGRDDGKLRVEIDDSQARLKWEDLQGKKVSAYRRIISGWDSVPRDERRVIESFAELCWESDEASKLLNESEGENLAENRRNAMKLADEVKERRAEVRDVIGRLFRQMGADSSVAITAQDDMVDAMALDFWSEWPSAKVEDSLVSDPMEFGMELGDVLDYPELYEAYPQLKDLRVYTDDLKGYNGLAGHNGWSDYITMNRSLLGDWEKFRSTLLHEVQHVIQRIEGFAKGGNKESVRRQVKDLLEGTEARMEFLERDLRWFSAVDIARDFLKEARMLRRYPNAWKRSGQRFRFARMSSTADEVREAILRDIAERYEKFRRDDTGETLLLEMEDSLLPEVHFSTLEGIEAGLAALDKIKSRKLAFRGTAARKSRRLADLQKRYNGIKRVLDEFEYEPYELYVRLAGEIEARNVQLRRDWTAEQRAAKPFNETLEYPGEALVAFSVTSMADAAKGLMSGGGMEITRAGELIKDFNAQIDNWNRVAAGKDGRADARTGAELFGTVQALLSAARRVLPDGYRVNVYTQMQWASVYAGMAETGQLPEAGALKGNAKILEAFRKRMLNETAMAADKAEAEAMLASIGEQKLNEVMVKVLQQVRGQLAKYAKDELWAKAMRVVERAYAKDEQGKKPKRGKMAAVDYKKLERLSELLRMEPDAVREEMDGLQGKLSGAKDAERVAELEAELAELSTFGGWSGMSLQQAAAAYEAMVMFCATGRTSWKQMLDRRKAEIEFMAREMSKALPTDRTASATRLAEQNKLLKAMAKLPYGMMNYCQLMLAMSSRLGEGFCWERIQEMTEANAALLNAEKGRMAWMYKLVQGVSGRKGEVACEKWLAEFDTPEDTGIELSPMAWCEVEMTLEAAEEWLAAGKEEREKRWAEREKEEKRRRVSLRLTQPMVPEALIPELKKAVKEYRENPRRSSGKVTVRGEYVDKGRAKTLTCSRDGALYAILLHEQSDYQTVFDRGQVAEAGLLYREGLNTPAKIQALYDFVGPAGLRYGYELRKALQKQGLTVAQVFEAREGVPFRFRDNYFRASFDRLAVQDKNPLTDSKVSGIGGGKYGMLVNRVAHHQEAAKWDMGASMVFLAASMEQDNYIYTSHITDRWRKLLMQRDFARRLQAYVGDDVMKKLVAWMDVIDGAPLDNMSAFMNLSHWQGFFTGAWASSVLNGNGYVLMKQASALWHGYVAGYVPESIREQEDGIRELSYRHIGMAEFLHYAAAGGPVSLAELKESKYFTARRTAVGKGVAIQGRMNAGRQRSALAVPSEVMGDWIEKTDSSLNLLSARALANAFYAAHKKLNEQHGNLLTDAELKAAAIDAVGRMLELGAQPLTRMQKGIFQNSSGMLGKMTFAMKSESINKLGLMCAQWTHGEHAAPVAAWLTLGLMNAGIAYLISVLQGDDDEKDTWATHATSIGVSAVTGPLSAVPVLSEGIAELASMITGERVYSDSLARQIVDVGNLKRQAEKLYKHHSGEREMGWERYFKTITTLLRSSGAGFGAFSRSGSAALSSFGSLALSAASGANLSRVAKDVLCAVGLFDREKEGKKKKPKRD